MPPVFISCGHSKPGSKVLSHRHNDTEMVYLMNGNCIHKVAKNDYPALPGCVMFIPAAMMHYELRNEPVETRYVVFRDTGPAPLNSPKLVDTENDKLIKRWILDLAELQAPSEQDQRNALLRAVLNRIEQIEQHSVALRNRHPALNKAVALMEQKLSDPLTVSGVARQCGVSTSYLNALFNTEFGSGPSKYLLDLRMEMARQLLGNPYLSIAEIGSRCGFDQACYFCRMFKKIHQCSPGEFRQKRYS